MVLIVTRMVVVGMTVPKLLTTRSAGVEIGLVPSRRSG